jgi:hypothetical protein
MTPILFVTCPMQQFLWQLLGGFPYQVPKVNGGANLGDRAQEALSETIAISSSFFLSPSVCPPPLSLMGKNPCSPCPCCLGLRISIKYLLNCKDVPHNVLSIGDIYVARGTGVCPHNNKDFRKIYGLIDGSNCYGEKERKGE